MQYGQIVFLLFIAFLFYYAVLIVLDIQKAKMAQAAEQENHSEEEIDISDEARSFKPVRIERDEPPVHKHFALRPGPAISCNTKPVARSVHKTDSLQNRGPPCQSSLSAGQV